MVLIHGDTTSNNASYSDISTGYMKNGGKRRNLRGSPESCDLDEPDLSLDLAPRDRIANELGELHTAKQTVSPFQMSVMRNKSQIREEVSSQLNQPVQLNNTLPEPRRLTRKATVKNGKLLRKNNAPAQKSRKIGTSGLSFNENVLESAVTDSEF